MKAGFILSYATAATGLAALELARRGAQAEAMVLLSFSIGALVSRESLRRQRARGGL